MVRNVGWYLLINTLGLSLIMKTTFKLPLIILGAFLFCLPLKAQDIHKYRIYFTDKGSEIAFDPFTYFDAKAIERRIRMGLPLAEFSDYPVNETYLMDLSQMGIQIKQCSRWLNAATVWASDVQIERVKQLHFVAEIELCTFSVCTPASIDEELFDDDDEALLLERQTTRLGAKRLAADNLNGNGIRVAIFDVGYAGADNHDAFEHLRIKNRIIKTWDFVDNDGQVYHGGTHGTSVWSCVGGKVDSSWSGLAWDAEFLLARTEMARSEPFSEEENWVAAAEWADQNGADIINSSLGYTDTRYFPEQMNGKKTFITRGANIAARKGMLVVNAAGNEGSGKWRIIGAPADADSVLAVGGLEPCCDYRIDFSSYGPTADKRLKPNVSAQGRVYCATDVGNETADGTSFASPLVAGLAACLWQKERSLTNMQLFRKIEASGHLYPYYDYAHGYGMPTYEKFIESPKVSEYITVEQDAAQNEIRIVCNDTTTAAEEQKLLYYAIVNPAGLLMSYYVISVSERIPLILYPSNYPPASRLRLSFKGQYLEIPL